MQCSWQIKEDLQQYSQLNLETKKNCFADYFIRDQTRVLLMLAPFKLVSFFKLWALITQIDLIIQGLYPFLIDHFIFFHFLKTIFHLYYFQKSHFFSIPNFQFQFSAIKLNFFKLLIQNYLN